MYDNIFAKDVNNQKAALFKDLLRIRKDSLLKQDQSSSSLVDLRGGVIIYNHVLFSLLLGNKIIIIIHPKPEHLTEHPMMFQVSECRFGAGREIHV